MLAEPASSEDEEMSEVISNKNGERTAIFMHIPAEERRARV